MWHTEPFEARIAAVSNAFRSRATTRLWVLRCTAMHFDWQTVLVVVIEVLAVLYLVRKLVLPARPKRSKRPDVAASSLVRKKK